MVFVIAKETPRRKPSGRGRRGGGLTACRHAVSLHRASFVASEPSGSGRAFSTAASPSIRAPASSHAAAAPIVRIGDASSDERTTSSIVGSTPAAWVNAAKLRTSRFHHVPTRRAPSASSSVRRFSNDGFPAATPAAARAGSIRFGSAGLDASISTTMRPSACERSAGRDEPVYSALVTASGKTRTRNDRLPAYLAAAVSHFATAGASDSRYSHAT